MDGVCPFAEQIVGVTGFLPGHGDRVGFCDHTAGGFYSTMQSAAFWNGRGVSTHFAISRQGEICQMVNIFDTAFAQGILNNVSWAPYRTVMGGQNPNLYLISTEHEDAETVNGATRFIPGSEWTPAQYAADLRLKRWCIEEVARVLGKDLMRLGIDSLAGHHMFDAINRAECPGRFWRNDYRQRLFMDLTAPQADEEEDGPMYIVSKAKTGMPDFFKSYLVRGKEFRHIPDKAHFDAVAALKLDLYEPDKTAWEFITQGATIIEE